MMNPQSGSTSSSQSSSSGGGCMGSDAEAEAATALTTSSSSRRGRKGELPPLFYYMEMGDWERANQQVRKHPREVRTWATLRTKSMATTEGGGEKNRSNGNGGPKVSGTKRLALHHACFKLRTAGSLPPATGKSSSEDPFVEVCRFIITLIGLHPDAAGQRESRHGCLPLHLAAFASCAPRSAVEQEVASDHSPGSPSSRHRRNGSGSLLSKPGLISRRSLSEASAATQDTANMSAIHAEETYAGEIGDKSIRRSKNLRPENPNVSVSARSNIVIHPKREEMSVRVVNALLDAYPKAVRVDSEGGRLPLHTACAGRATPRVIETLVTAYPAAARHRNKDGFLPLHLAAHWGVSHPNVAILLLKAYPDATVGRNRWERTPLEEALCMAGENGRPHQASLVRALRKHPSYWTRPPAELFAAASPSPSPTSRNERTSPVDIDESLPSNESSTMEEPRRYLNATPLMLQEVRELGDAIGHEIEIPDRSAEAGAGAGGNLVSRLSPRSLAKRRTGLRNLFEEDPAVLPAWAAAASRTASLACLVRDKRWPSVLARIRANPLEAEEELEVMTRGGFIATSGMTALHYACERTPPAEVVRALIKAYPMAVLTRTMPGGSLPLHVACTWHASPGVVGALLSADRGACQIADELGNVPLHSACFSGADVLVVESLLAADGNGVLARNHQGSRPMDICKRLRHENRRSVMASLAIKKEQVLAQHHRRSRSSGTWSDVAKEAADLNDRLGTPRRSNNGCDRETDLILEEQAVGVEVSYQGRDNQELVWI